ncbi:MAG: hypothetical protein AAF845_08475 [Bacteroidota bacterium]
MRFALLVLLLAFAAGCAGTAPRLYESAPLTAATQIDGDADDWRGTLLPVPNETGLQFGVRNDGETLAVVVVAGAERQARRIALGGLRIWLDPAAGADPQPALGVRFPTPAPPDPADLRSQRGTPHPIRMRARFDDATEAVEIQRGGSVVTQKADVGSVPGLETAAQWTERDGMIVELRVPLAATDRLLPTDAGDRLGVGIELADLPGFDTRIGGQRRAPMPGGPSRVDEAPTLETTARWFVVDLAE